MSTQKTLIGTIPIKQIEQEVTEFVEKVTEDSSILLDAFYWNEDPEGRGEIVVDASTKVVSYRKEDGTKVECVGVETDNIKSKKVESFEIKSNKVETNDLTLPENAINQVKDIVDHQIDTHIKSKKWYLPKFGNVNIKEETFYLDISGWSSYTNDVVLIQMYDDTEQNGAKRITLSTFYIKNTLTPSQSGEYDRNSVNENSIALDLHAGKDVTLVDNKYFAKTIYTPIIAQDGAITGYNTNKATKVVDPVTGYVIGYTYNGVSTEVRQVKDIPPYKAWKVFKEIEHYCVADIDFGTFYSKNNVPVGIKYQGSSTTAYRKRGFRLTFYKKNDYNKKDKVKIGEMVRLSGYNMKSYAEDATRVKDPIISNLFIEMWNTRGKDAYPWNKDSVPFNGATGMVKSFPIETKIGGEFFGLQMFGLKKDEKNFMLDGDDDASGIYVQGESNDPYMWVNGKVNQWSDEMMDDMSQETTDAIAAFLKVIRQFILGYTSYKDANDNVYDVNDVYDVSESDDYATGKVDKTIEGVTETIDVVGYEVFDNAMFEEVADLEGFIDYYIGLQIFNLHDSSQHNMQLTSRRDKKKFSPFFYDLDGALSYGGYERNILEVLDTLQRDASLWKKIGKDYTDSIINRYAELRKTVFTDQNIESVYKTYVSDIPEDVIQKEIAKWGNGNPALFEQTMIGLKNRLNMLDNNYFYLKN